MRAVDPLKRMPGGILKAGTQESGVRNQKVQD